MIKYILGILACALFLSSCLDKDVENAVSDDGVDYSQSADMFKPVAGTYFEAAVNFTYWPNYGLLCIRTQEVNKGSDPGDQGPLNDAINYQYSMIADYWGLNDAFLAYYTIILTANGALESLDKYAEYLTSEDQRKLNREYKAEVRFMRAYAYFFLARLWGNVPMVHDNSDITDKHLVKTPYNTIMRYIVDELDDIEGYLQAKNPNEMNPRGRVTKYSALALKAKACADINEWDAVLDATDRIVGSNKFELYPDFYQYFKKPGRYCDENLYEIQFSDLQKGEGMSVSSWSWFEFQGPRLGFKGEGALKDGWGFLCPNQKLVKFFEDRGEKDKPRAKTTFLYSGTITDEGDEIVLNSGDNLISNGKAYYPKSHMTPGRIDYGMGNNIRMLRYGDILLLNAEAKVRKGQNGDVPFNLVRKRAKMQELSNVTVDQILEERQAELACEWGERFFDMVRTKKAKDVLQGFVEGKSEFYPIPQPQVDLNPNLR